MFLLEWIYKLLFGEDAANDMRPSPKRRKKRK
jgi:hypothetical protein